MDTSTSVITAACLRGGDALSEVTVRDGQSHGELLAPTLVQAMNEAGTGPSNLTRIVVGVGPGPFTGLRVGISTALVMGHSLGIPVVGVCSLDAIAAGVGDRYPEFIVTTDARRKEVYWARYAVTDGRFSRISGPAVSRASDLPSDLAALPAVGVGAQLYPESLTAGRGPLDVSAADLGALVSREDMLLPPEPLYLRRPDAVPSARTPTFTAPS